MSSQPVCFSTRLRKAARAANRRYDIALSDLGVGVAQYALLRALQRLGGPTINTLATDTRLDPSTLGRNLRVLERGGLIAFSPGEDRRTRVITVTPRGQDLLGRAFDRWRSVQSDLEARLGPGGREALFALLDTLEAA